MKKIIEKNFFLVQITPSDFVALYCLYQGTINAIGIQCVRNKF